MRISDGMGVSLAGLDLVGDDDSGVSWRVNDIGEWWSAPGSTGVVQQNVFGDGGWAGPAFREPMPLRLVGRAIGPDRPAASRAANRLNSILPYTVPAPLVVSEDGAVTHRMVRVEGKPSLSRPTDVYVPFDIQLVAPDPRRFSGDGSTKWPIVVGPVGLPVSTGGLRIGPAVNRVRAPFRVVASQVSGTVVLSTVGDALPPVMIRLDGPFPDATIQTADGGQLVYTEALAAGQWVEIDLDARTVKLNGAINRRNRLVGRWIIPAAGMEFKFTSSVYNPDATMTLYASDAWS